MENQIKTTWYAVMAVRPKLKLEIMGLEQEINYPHLRVFKNKSEAEEFAQGKFEVMGMLAEKSVNTDKQ